MIGTRTPFRISFVGGGSDLKEFYSRSPGCVLITTINQYMYIFVHKFFDDRIQIKYSKTELVVKAKKYLCESDLEGFGKTLDENWKLKRSLSNKTSNTDIDNIYSLAINNGALGGKLLGAGGGGFFLFYCNKEKQDVLMRVLSSLK